MCCPASSQAYYTRVNCVDFIKKILKYGDIIEIQHNICYVSKIRATCVSSALVKNEIHTERSEYMPEIGIILGSDSDLPKIKECFRILDDFSVSYEVIVASAHRTPARAMEWASGAAS